MGPLHRGRLFFFRGRVTLGQSDADNLNLGVQLVKDGHLTTEAYQRTATAAMERRLGLHQILEEERIVDDDMVKEAYRSLIRSLSLKVSQWRVASDGSPPKILPGTYPLPPWPFYRC